MSEIACHQVMRVVRYAQACGFDVARILQRSETTLSALEQPHARVPYAVAERVVLQVAEAVGHDDFGPSIAAVYDIAHFDAAILSVLSASTIREVVVTLVDLQRAWADGERVLFVEHGDDAVVQVRHGGVSRRVAAIATEFSMSDVWILIRNMGGLAHLCPLRAEVTHQRLGPSFGAALGLLPRYEAADNRLTFSRALLDLETKPPLPLLHHALALKAQRELRDTPLVSKEEPTWPVRVRQHIMAHLDQSDLSIDHVASLLHMSTRTLQRRLAQSGTSFDALHDDARKARMQTLLAGGMPLKEICFRVGFSEPSALSRARKRWGI